jgi:hypothetical protein
MTDKVINIKQRQTLKIVQDAVKEMYKFYGAEDGNWKPFCVFNNKEKILHVMTQQTNVFEISIAEDPNLTIQINPQPIDGEESLVGFIYNLPPIIDLNEKDVRTLYRLLKYLKDNRCLPPKTESIIRSIVREDIRIYHEPITD